MNIVVLGSTDTTKTCVDTLCDIGFAPRLIVAAEEHFTISYSQAGKVQNYRHFGFDKKYEEKGIRFKKFISNEDLNAFLCSSEIDFRPDLAIVAGWYYFVPKSVRANFSRGCVGFHASKLPQLRGGAPLNWALLSGFKKTGVSMFELTDGVDDGPLWDQEVFQIHDSDYILDLISKANTGVDAMLRRTIPRIARNDLIATPQCGVPSYSLQRTPLDGAINWRSCGRTIERLIKAVSNPYPGAYSFFSGKKVFIWRGRSAPKGPIIYGMPGQIFVGPDKRIYVITGSTALEILETTFENGECAMKFLQQSNNKRFLCDTSDGP